MKHFSSCFYSLLFVSLLLLSAGNSAARAERPIVVTTVFPIQNLVSQITGADIRVDGIYASAHSPHAFEPTQEDIAKIERADLLVCVGLGLDDWAVALAEKKKTPTVVLSELLNEPPAADPHLWMDPMLMTNAVTILQRVLIKHFPSYSPAISSGARRTVDSLFALDSWISAELSPYIGSTFVSHHRDLERFAQRYGLATIAVLTQSSEDKPSPEHLAEVAEKLKRFTRRIIFYQPQFDEHAVQEVAQKADARLVEIDPEGNLRAPGRENYFRLMRYNVRQMVTAFQNDE